MGKIQCNFCKAWVSEYSKTSTCNCGLSGSILKDGADIFQAWLDANPDEEPQYWLCERCNKPNVYKSQSCKYCGSKR